MTRVPVTHEPTFEFTGLSHWCSCSCSWRSGLASSKSEIEAQFQTHLETT